MSSNGSYATTQTVTSSNNNNSTANTSSAGDYLIDHSIVSYINAKPLDEIQMYQFNDEEEHHHDDDDGNLHHLHHLESAIHPAQHQSVILIVNEDGTTSTIKNLVDSNTCLIINNSSEQQLSHNASTNSLELLNESSSSSASSNSSDENSASSSSKQAEQQQHAPKYKQFIPMSNIVPTMSNVEDIFQLLSQKIAKYCQILTDLTNCEVFYKAQLHISDAKTAVGAAAAAATPPPKTNNSKYKPKNVVNKNVRSLYWGTHKMLFQHSHGHGLKYEKSNGDSLIKIGHRSLSNDINSLIEELLNMNEPTGEPSMHLHHHSKQPVLMSNPAATAKTSGASGKRLFKSYPGGQKTGGHDSVAASSSTCFLPVESVDLKECFIGLERLDDNVFEQYLNKFEVVNNNAENERNMFDLNDLVEECRLENEFEIYSDEFKVNLNRFLKNTTTTSGSQSGGSGSRVARRVARKRRKCTDDMVNNGTPPRSNDDEEEDSDQDQNNEDDDEEDEEEDEDLDERTLLERNCFNINEDAELNENGEDYYSCEYCSGHYYKHLPQLKVISN
jgi:hypothetical protein